MNELLAMLVGFCVPVMVWLLVREAEEAEYEARHRAAQERLRREFR